MDRPVPNRRIVEAVMAHLAEAGRLLGEAGAVDDGPGLDERLRSERLDPYRNAITDEDARRIVSGRLDSKAWGHVERFLAALEDGSPRRFLWLAGGMGCGKTVAAMGAIAEIGGRYVTADEVRRGYVQETDEARAIRDRVTHCRLLVVDDCGAERDEAQARFALQELVNARQSGRRVTILTGNLTREQIARRYDPRTLDRMTPPRGAIVSVGGGSMRTGASS